MESGSSSNSLAEPLLTQQQHPDLPNNMSPQLDEEEVWSEQAAQLASLYIPMQWQVENAASPTCNLRYDAERDLLFIVGTKAQPSDGQPPEELVLDVIEPADIIGAELRLDFFGDAESVDPSRRRVGFQNEKARVLQEAISKDMHGDNYEGESRCNIFGALKNDWERVFSIDRACASEIPYDSQATAYLNIYVYPRRRPSEEGWLSWCGVTSHEKLRNTQPPAPVEAEKLGNRYPMHRCLEVVPRKDFCHVGALVRSIRRVAKLQHFSQGKSRPLRFLVICNPVGGKKKALEIYQNTMKPMLNQACVDHDVCVTRAVRHAEERMISAEVDENDLDEYDGVIAIGGDGLLHEIFNGVSKRNDADELMKRLKFGIVCAGTGNGLSKSLLHVCQEPFGIMESIFLVCKGQTQKMDLSRYELQEKSYTGFLTFSWGFIADIDIESECIRFCGVLRNDIWAAWCVLKKRMYRARFSFLRASKVNKDEAIDMPALSDPVPDDWETMEDDFFMFWASQVTHAASNVYHSPDSSLHDGVFQVLVVRAPVSRLKTARIALGFETGSHVNFPETEVYECVAWRLEPISTGSFNDLDGEKIESGPIQTHVLPSAAQILCINNESE